MPTKNSVSRKTVLQNESNREQGTQLYSGENGRFLHLAQVTQLESTRAWALVSVCVTGQSTWSCLPFPLRLAAMLKITTWGRQNHTGDILPPSQIMVPSKLSPKARDDTSKCRLGHSHSGGSKREGTGSQTVLEKPPPLPQSSQSCYTSQGNALSWPPSNTRGMWRWTRCVALSGLLSLCEPQSLALDAGPCAEMQGGRRQFAHHFLLTS